MQLLLLSEPKQPDKCGFAPGVELARLRRPRRVDPPVGEDPVGRSVGDDRETGDGQATGAHRFGDRLECRIVADEPSGVAVLIDDKRATEKLACCSAGLTVGSRLSSNPRGAKTGDERGRSNALQNSTPRGRAQVSSM